MKITLQTVTSRKIGRPDYHYTYIRGTKLLVQKTVGGPKPKHTKALIGQAKVLLQEKGIDQTFTLRTIITEFQKSAYWSAYAESTRGQYRAWIPRILEEFGDIPLTAMRDLRFGQDIVEWRDSFASNPGKADAGLSCLSRLLRFAVQKKWLEVNHARDVDRLYRSHRAGKTWSLDDFRRFRAVVNEAMWEAVLLEVCTGLRIGDLVQLPWSAVTDDLIVWNTQKSGRRTTVRIPVLPEARKLFDRIKARHAAEMAQLPPEQRKPLPPTVLANMYWDARGDRGFRGSIYKALKKAGIEVHFHDLRGNFVTRLILAGVPGDWIARIMGWRMTTYEMMKKVYVDDGRLYRAIARRIAGISIVEELDDVLPDVGDMITADLAPVLIEGGSTQCETNGYRDTYTVAAYGAVVCAM